MSHPGTIGHDTVERRPAGRDRHRERTRPCGCRSLSPMTPLGIGIVGTGNIAGGYAKDALTHPEIRLVAATDLDPDRAAAFAATHGIRAHASLDDLLADDEVDIVINLTVHHAHYEVTKRALEAGKHVYSEKPLALRSERGSRARRAGRRSRGLRLGCSPSTFLGEAQQTAAAVIRSGRLGPVRAIYAEVNWGRIETWHPAPAPVLRRRRPGRRRGLPAHAGHDDARPGAVGPRLGLGPAAGPHDARRDAVPDRQPGPDRRRRRARMPARSCA